MYYGDLGKRIIAYILDSIIISLFLTLLSFINIFITLSVGAIITWLYIVLMEGSSWHATLGKKMMGLYIADENGNGITYATSILRSIGKLFSGLFLGIGYFMGCFNDKKQCLHDMIAKTYVLAGEPYDYPIKNNARPVNSGDYDSLPELVGVSGPLSGMVYKIDEKGLVIGRDTLACGVVLPSSQGKVSRIHCYVTYNFGSGMFVLNDRNSSHGTFLSNGSRVLYTKPVALKSGDRFYLSTPENAFEVR